MKNANQDIPEVNNYAAGLVCRIQCFVNTGGPFLYSEIVITIWAKKSSENLDQKKNTMNQNYPLLFGLGLWDMSETTKFEVGG